jgi:vesicle transport through interaction with t-SNAREs protein 1
MSHAIFQSYDEEFTSISSAISKEMTALKSLVDHEDCTGKIRMVEALMRQCVDLMKQMEIEVRSQDGPTRIQLGDKLALYRKAQKNQQADFESAKAKASKEALMGGGGVSGDQRSLEQDRLLGVNDKLYRQNEMILSAQRTVFETEEVGADIVNELSRNREKIESAQERARDFIGTADSARRLIGSMQRRESQHKFLMYALLFSLLVALCAGIYYASFG